MIDFIIISIIESLTMLSTRNMFFVSNSDSLREPFYLHFSIISIHPIPILVIRENLDSNIEK